MKIKNIKKTGSTYKFTLESGEIITTYDEVIIKYGLLFKKNINSKLLDNISRETTYYKYYNKALDMIERRLRSEYEIREYLKKQEVKEENIEKIINDLKKINLINDEAFAKAYTNDKIRLSLDGPYKIKKNLENNKIEEEYINLAISNINEKAINEHIDKIISKKIKNNTKYTSYILKQKIITYLINLGYSKSSIINRLNNFNIESKSSEREMDKIYNKLKRKYEGDILHFKLKTKLYAKGYTQEEINEYINKKQLI